MSGSCVTTPQLNETDNIFNCSLDSQDAWIFDMKSYGMSI